jgi:hypothetical protein
MKIRLCTALTLIAVAGFAGAPARAATYPVTGNWTYENATEKGPAKSCGKRNMQFDGNLRHDTGSGAPEYKNISVTKSGAATWNIVDEFFTGMMRGRVPYTLRIIDPDHFEMKLEKGGAVMLLRRCQ